MEHIRMLFILAKVRLFKSIFLRLVSDKNSHRHQATKLIYRNNKIWPFFILPLNKTGLIANVRLELLAGIIFRERNVYKLYFLYFRSNRDWLAEKHVLIRQDVPPFPPTKNWNSDFIRKNGQSQVTPYNQFFCRERIRLLKDVPCILKSSS